MPAIWTALSASVQGALHKKMGRQNQDAVRVYEAADLLCLAVADGHGSPRSFRSDRGALFATESAIGVIRDLTWRLGKDAPLSSLRRQLITKLPGTILREWQKAVRRDIAREPFSDLDFAALPEEAPKMKNEEVPFSAYLAYGATLVLAVMTPKFIAYLQLGDGDILLIHQDGSVTRPWAREHAFFSTQTVSLCSPGARAEFRVRVEPRRANAPALIFLATDGYANCFADDAGFFTVGSDLLGYLRESSPAFVQERLEQWLSESSRDGSGDDITVALAVRRSVLADPAGCTVVVS